jgi:hypothetical protein
MVIVKGNPLSDLSCLAEVQAVMKEGRWVMSPLLRMGTPENGGLSAG